MRSKPRKVHLILLPTCNIEARGKVAGSEFRTGNSRSAPTGTPPIIAGSRVGPGGDSRAWLSAGSAPPALLPSVPHVPASGQPRPAPRPRPARPPDPAPPARSAPAPTPGRARCLRPRLGAGSLRERGRSSRLSSLASAASFLAAAEPRPEPGRGGCSRSQDPAVRPCSPPPPSEGTPGRAMVKVTFNSALAQKEAKKDEPKSSEEALIIPPDAVAVDCKVRGPGRSGTGRLARRGALRGAGAALRAEVARPPGAGLGAAREPSPPFFSGCCPFLSRRSFFVRKCVCRKRCFTRVWGLGRPGERRIKEWCQVHGCWCRQGLVRGARTSFVRPGDQRRHAKQQKQQQSLALPPSINNVPKMADIIRSLNRCCFLLFLSRLDSTWTKSNYCKPHEFKSIFFFTFSTALRYWQANFMVASGEGKERGEKAR